MTSSPASPARERTFGRLEAICWAMCILVGFMALWVRQNAIYADGISYLEIAGNYRKGNWHAAVNAYWSPLFSWVLAAAEFLLRPPPKWEVPLLHFVNFLAFVGSLFTFRFFLRELTAAIHDRGLQTDEQHAAWIIVAYAVFLWGGQFLSDVLFVTPDAIVNLLLYGVAGVILSIGRGRVQASRFALLGLLLATCYLTKSLYFFASAFFLFPLVVVVKPLRTWLKCVSVAGIVFLICCAPWIVAISAAKGYWTVGDSGILNYAWESGNVRRYTHWQGGPGGAGTPVHPTRVLSDFPAAFEFGEPIHATYPPWYDPSYWYEGVKPTFNLSQQIRTLVLNLRLIAGVFVLAPGLFWWVGYMAFDRGFRRRAGDFMTTTRHVWVPFVCLIALYTLVFIEVRYIVSASVIVVLSVLAGGFVGLQQRGAARDAGLVAALTCTFLLSSRLWIYPLAIAHNIAVGQPIAPNPYWQIAEEVTNLGLNRGARIAYIGNAMNADWARMMELGIVAEVPVRFDRESGWQRLLLVSDVDTNTFWSAPSDVKVRILESFRRAGADAVAADFVPTWADTSDWVRLKTPISRREGTEWTYVQLFAR